MLSVAAAAMFLLLGFLRVRMRRWLSYLTLSDQPLQAHTVCRARVLLSRGKCLEGMTKLVMYIELDIEDTYRAGRHP